MLKTIKRLWIRFFPASKRQIMELTEKIDKLERELHLHNEEQTLFNEKRQAELKDIIFREHNVGKERFEKTISNTNKKSIEIFNSIAGIQKKIEDIGEGIENIRKNEIYNERKYLYSNDYERRVIKSFADEYRREDYRTKFLNLIHGLDDVDVNKIVCILKRQQIAVESKGMIDLFFDEEQTKIKSMLKSFQNEIFKVDDDLYIYRNYKLPVNHFEPSVFYFKHGLEEVRNIKYTFDKDIVDVGGFIGDSILVLKPYTSKKIYTFEAIEQNYMLLLKTVELNDLDNVIAEHLALGNENIEIDMKVAGSASTSETCFSTVYGSEKVKMVRFDDYVKENNLQVGLIKIDIEGAEQDFLAGAKETITSQKPILLCSIYHNANDFFEIKPLLESWKVGYKFHIHKPIDTSISREVLLIAEPE